MRLKVKRSITFFVVLLFSLRILGATAAAVPLPSDDTEIHSKESGPYSALATLLSEKAEEQCEKSGAEKEGMARVVLIDFSRVASSLAYYYSSHGQLLKPTFQYDVRPPLHQLNCVFII